MDDNSKPGIRERGQTTIDQTRSGSHLKDSLEQVGRIRNVWRNSNAETYNQTSGIRFQQQFFAHQSPINRIAWSPDGDLLATPSDDCTVQVWGLTGETPVLLAVLDGHAAGVDSVVWSPGGEQIASASRDTTVRIWDVVSGNEIRKLGHLNAVQSLAWVQEGELLATCSGGTIRYWDPLSGRVRKTERNRVSFVSWGPAEWRVTASSERESRVFVQSVFGGDIAAAEHPTPAGRRPGVPNVPICCAWSSDGQIVVLGWSTGSITLAKIGRVATCQILEGHTGRVVSVSLSADETLLTSKSVDGTVRIWSTKTGSELARAQEKMARGWKNSGVAFHPCAPILATQSTRIGELRIWRVGSANELQDQTTNTSTAYTSAKIVLVGESNVGKSCLALRLAEGRYEEQGTTHGMKVWPTSVDRLGPAWAPPPDERRELVLWDMGGQDEYRLIHQLFLHDTTVALILFDPTRGRTALEEVEGWNKRLDRQLGQHRAIKILVGTKLDHTSELVDSNFIERVIESCGFSAYIETSARTNRGIDELREALRAAINWPLLSRTVRPDLFQKIREEIERVSLLGEAVILFDALVSRIMRSQSAQADIAAVDLVVQQLSMQGLLAETTLASGERALVLKVPEVERYAGSLIVLARNNPRLVPALEAETLVSHRSALPGISADSRLDPLAERVVLECVVQLLLQHGICFRHQGLLIFPSLFPITESTSDDDATYNASIYYDFSGAIDNIYASLVTRLAMSGTFGRPRLWEDRAEFDSLGLGVFGIRNSKKRAGFAKLDLYFSEDCSEDARSLFTVFVEEHLRADGVDIAEELTISCPLGYRFDSDLIRRKALAKQMEVLCPACEYRHTILPGANQARADNPEIEARLLALKTKIDNQKRSAIYFTKEQWKLAEREDRSKEPYRILHLSDLHIGADSDPRAMLEPLKADLRDPKEGLGVDYLDFLVISGDISCTASKQEFEKAFDLVSSLVREFKLSSQRCIFVPGNHDLGWIMPYDWRVWKGGDTRSFQDGHYVEQDRALAVRNEDRYPARFKEFSEAFYHPFFQLEYPLSFEDQHTSLLFEEAGIQFVALNSSWQIDEFFPERAGIHPGALERSLAVANEQLAAHRRDNGSPETCLRIAIWHHPVSGPECMQDIAFLDRLRQSDFQLCLHGHVHESRAELLGYTHARKLHVIGAGSFGAPQNARPESTPRLYNLVEIERDHSRVRVHTRCLRLTGSAWEGWAVWPGEAAFEKRSYYEIQPF